MLHFNLGSPFEIRYSDLRRCAVHPTTIVGHQTWRGSDLIMAEGVEAFAVFFEPTGFSQIFRIPLRHFIDQTVEAGSVLGDTICSLRARIGEARTFEGRVRIVEDFLLRQLASVQDRSRFTLAADQLFAARGVVRIGEVANGVGLSQRQFERGFLTETGCSPKLYARVARFQTALDMKVAAPRRSWLEIAHRLYYHDQMHMVHDFRDLSGNSPDRFMAELGEARPEAVVALPDPGAVRGVAVRSCRPGVMH